MPYQNSLTCAGGRTRGLRCQKNPGYVRGRPLRGPALPIRQTSIPSLRAWNCGDAAARGDESSSAADASPRCWRAGLRGDGGRGGGSCVRDLQSLEPVMSGSGPSVDQRKCRRSDSNRHALGRARDFEFRRQGARESVLARGSPEGERPQKAAPADDDREAGYRSRCSAPRRPSLISVLGSSSHLDRTGSSVRPAGGFVKRDHTTALPSPGCQDCSSSAAGRPTRGGPMKRAWLFSRSRDRCAYRSVIRIVECPRYSFRTLMSPPLSMYQLANV